MYIDRDKNGNITGLYRRKQREGQEYLEGAELTPVDSVPVSVERYQARVALYNAGLLDQVESIMDDESTDIVAREAWMGASVIRRDSVIVAAIGSILGLTEEQKDELFIAASKIKG